MKYGVIDIGSNTIRLAIYRIVNERIEYLLNQKIFARAVTYKKNSRMLTQGIKAIIDALMQFKELASHHELAHLWCFATAPLRNIDNADDVIASVRESAGLQIEIISGNKEAELGVKGLGYAFDLQNAFSIDLGGGSCEISLIKDSALSERTSMDFGSVSLTNEFVSEIYPKRNEIKRIENEVDMQISKIRWLKNANVDCAYALGGSARAMCSIHKVKYESAEDKHGYRIFSDDIEPLYKELISKGVEGIKLLDQHCPGRIFTVIPGMIIFRRILISACVPVIRLSRYGVREGYLLEKTSELHR